jgi:aryl-alcohol dehydrogenase-like predicted oxidoreductase
VETIDVSTTGMRVSRVGLGTWAIGGWMWGGTDDDASIATIHRALEQGISLIDTAPAYGTTFAGDDLRRTDPKFAQPLYGQYLRAVRRLDDLARSRFGKRVIDLAVLWGARHPNQLDAMGGAFGFQLDRATFDEVDRILAEEISSPVGPEFMAPPENVGV